MKTRMLTAALVAACGCTVSLADDMPAAMFSSNTIAVVSLDMTDMGADNVTDAVGALFDYDEMEEAGIDTSFKDDMDAGLDQGLAMYGFAHQALLTAGAEEVTVVVDLVMGDWGPEPQVRIYMPANDEQGMNMLEGFAAQFAMGAGMDFTAVNIDDQDFAVVYMGEEPKSRGGSRKTAGNFSEAISDIPEAAMRFAVIVPDDLKGELEEGLMMEAEDENMAELGSILINADWVGGRLTLGEDVSIGLGVKSDDVDTLEEIYGGLMDMLMDEAADTTRELRREGDINRGDVTPTDAAEMLVEAAEMEMAGSDIAVVELTTKELSGMLTMLARIGEQEGESLPDMLMNLGEEFSPDF